MRNLAELLGRFTRSLNQDQETKEVIIKVIQEKTQITLQPNEISLKEGVLEIKTTPVVKSEIMLKEKAIRERLKGYRINTLRISYK